ncbi:hypothetical protein M5D96_002880, partial [Drosophila gunungcola]
MVYSICYTLGRELYNFSAPLSILFKRNGISLPGRLLLCGEKFAKSAMTFGRRRLVTKQNNVYALWSRT